MAALDKCPPDVAAFPIATWYYWRWQIETFHKLLKSSGLQLEQWQQESASAVSKRLVVACMACVVVWRLERQTTPAAQACKELLMQLSGRQTKRSRPVTTAALLVGLHTLLATLSVLDRYSVEALRTIVRDADLPIRPTG